MNLRFTWDAWFEANYPQFRQEFSKGDHRSAANLYKVFGETYGRLDRHRQRKRAATLLAVALDGMDGGQVIRFFNRFRSSTSMEWFIDWRDKHPEKFLTPDMTPAERFWVVALATAHPCGHLRERALVVLTHESDGRALGMALWGLCDWVPQVRTAAEELLRATLSTATPADLCGAIPYAVAVLRSERVRGGTGSPPAALLAYTDALQGADCREMLTATLADGDIHTRRFCADLLAETKDGATVLVERLPREPDPTMRRYLFQRSMARFPFLADGSDGAPTDVPDGIPAPVALMLADKFPKNRCEGLYWLRLHAPDRALSPAMIALTDPNATVRTLAQDTVATLAPAFSVADFYRATVSAGASTDGHSLPAALCGLGETGTATDRERVCPYLQAPRSTVVSAALHALANLTPAEEMGSFSDTVTAHLTDSRAGVVKTAAALLCHSGCPDGERVTAIMTESPSELTRVRCLTVLSRTGKWRRLIATLTALTLGGEHLEYKARTMLERWMLTCNASFASPTAKEAAEAERLIELCVQAGKLDDDTRKQLSFLL